MATIEFIDNFNGGAKLNKLASHNYISSMQPPIFRKITIDKIHHPLLKIRKLNFMFCVWIKFILVISGNKWFKLKYHLDNFNAGNYKGILTFGGAWSNHIVATACTVI